MASLVRHLTLKHVPFPTSTQSTKAGVKFHPVSAKALSLQAPEIAQVELRLVPLVSVLLVPQRLAPHWYRPSRIAWERLRWAVALVAAQARSWHRCSWGWQHMQHRQQELAPRQAALETRNGMSQGDTLNDLCQGALTLVWHVPRHLLSWLRGIREQVLAQDRAQRAYAVQ